MKRVLLFMLVAVLGTGAAVAQQKSIIGKWKIARVNEGGLDINLEDPASVKKMLVEQMKKEGGGAAPDSATIEMVYTMATAVFEKITIEFTSDGKLITNVGTPDGKTTKDEGTYKVDYTSGIMNTTTKKDGSEDMQIRFEGDYLVMEKKGKGKEVVKLRRIKE